MWEDVKMVRVLQSGREVSEIPESIARLAYDDYAARYGTSQSFERLHERGGFSVPELIEHLASRVRALESEVCRHRG